MGGMATPLFCVHYTVDKAPPCSACSFLSWPNVQTYTDTELEKQRTLSSGLLAACRYSLSLYGDLQCQCVRCHKKLAIFRCMPLDSKHRLLNSAYYSRESLELLQFFILQHSPPLLPQSPQIIIISRTLLDAHTAINKSWPEIGADNSSAPAEQIVKSFQKRKPIGDIPILKLYNIQSPNWGTRSTLFPLCIYPIPFMSPNSCRLSFGWWWFLLLLLLILGCLPIFSVVINHLY